MFCARCLLAVSVSLRSRERDRTSERVKITSCRTALDVIYLVCFFIYFYLSHAYCICFLPRFMVNTSAKRRFVVGMYRVRVCREWGTEQRGRPPTAFGTTTANIVVFLQSMSYFYLVFSDAFCAKV